MIISDKFEAATRLTEKWADLIKTFGQLTYAVGDCEVEIPKAKYTELYSDMEKAYGPSTDQLVYRTVFGQVIIREKRK
jgi:hypothetical protein